MNRWNIPESLELEITNRDTRCVYCRVAFRASKQSRKSSATWEHIVNDARIVTRENIARCCFACNSSKGTKKLSEWLQSDYCKKRGITKRTVTKVVKLALTRLVLLIGLLTFGVCPAAQAQLCGPDVELLTKTVKTKAAVETAPPRDKALVYFVSTGTSVSTDRKVSVDRQWIGVVRSQNYFVAEVSPGMRDFCGVVSMFGGGVVSHVRTNLEPGKTYYFQFLAQTVSISEISAEDAAVYLRDFQTRRVFWQKGQPEPPA